MIRPEQIPVEGRWRGQVKNLSYIGSDVLVTLECEGCSLKLRRPAEQSPVLGETISFDLPLDKLWRIPERDPKPTGEEAP
jgi:hypothetical protein